MEDIKYEDFSKVDLRLATILEAREHPKADKLLILKVSLGDEERQIVAGIREVVPGSGYKPEDLKDKQIIVVANLEPRTLRGETSHGMLLAVKSDVTGTLSLLTTDRQMPAGLKVG